jgi:hypothetical protein
LNADTRTLTNKMQAFKRLENFERQRFINTLKNGKGVDQIVRNAVLLNTSKKSENRKTIQNLLNKSSLDANIKKNVLNRFEKNESMDSLRGVIQTGIKNLQNKKKSDFVIYVRSTNLPKNEQNRFIEQSSGNYEKVDQRVSEFISNQKNKNKIELNAYLKQTNLNKNTKNKILKNFQTLNQSKKTVNSLVAASKARKVKNLTNYANTLGVNATPLIQKLNTTNLERVKQNVDALAKTKEVSAITDYMKKQKLDAPTIKSILNQNLSFSESVKKVESIKQASKDKALADIKRILIKHDVDPMDRQRFYTMNNTNTIEQKVIAFKKEQKTKRLNAFKSTLNTMGIPPNEQVKYMVRFNTGGEPSQSIIDTIIKSRAINQTKQKSENRDKLVRYIQRDLKLDPKKNSVIVDNILGLFDTTHMNLEKLKNKARNQSQAKNDMGPIKDRDTFMYYIDYLVDTKQITLAQGDELLLALGGQFVDPSKLKQRVLEMIQNKKTNRDALVKVLNTLENLPIRDKFLRNFNTDKKNLKTIQKDIRSIQEKEKEKKTQAFKTYLTTVDITDDDKKKLMDRFLAGETNLQGVAKTMESRRKNNLRFELKNTIGLNAETVNKALTTNQPLKTANRLKKVQNTTELLAYLNTLNLMNTAEKSKILNAFKNSNAPMSTFKARAKIMQTLKETEKKARDRAKVQDTVKNLSANDQRRILSKLNTNSYVLNTILKNASNLKQKQSNEAIARTRADLLKYARDDLKLNANTIRNVMTTLEATNYTTAKKQANQANQARQSKQTAANKVEFTAFINALNIGSQNKQRLLTRFNSNPAARRTLETEAEKIRKDMNNTNRRRDRDALVRFMKELNISDANSILNGFTNLETAKKQLTELRRTKNIKQERNENNSKLAKILGNQQSLRNHVSRLKHLTPENRKTYTNLLESGKGTFTNLKEASSAKNNEIAKRKQVLSNRVNREVPGLYGAHRREWKAAINRALNTNTLDAELRKRFDLSEKIKSTTVLDPRTRGALLKDLMKINSNVDSTAKNLSEIVNLNRQVKRASGSQLVRVSRNLQAKKNRVAVKDKTRR